MDRLQKGITAPTVLLLVAIAVFFVILGFKCVPAFTEYFGVKRIVGQLVKEHSNSSAAEIRSAFDRKASIEYVTAIKGEDLDITKNGGAVSIVAEYDKPIRIFGDDDKTHVDLMFHFKAEEGSSGESAAE